MRGHLTEQNRADEVRELRKRLLIDLESLCARLFEAKFLARRAEFYPGHVIRAYHYVSVAKIELQALLAEGNHD